ncbi:hypothetical protein GJ496_001307 [Pomphorhynchus laevis]|nr:hypothetical protein GJ496_001307 [Pomphorhynchus laevis]
MTVKHISTKYLSSYQRISMATSGPTLPRQNMQNQEHNLQYGKLDLSNQSITNDSNHMSTTREKIESQTVINNIDPINECKGTVNETNGR